ncbi:MAG: CRISPR-associated endonuclease Cas2 [Candidatus Moranbacteria bacterium]|nr:CRISPR-associated endonuclease Cas2 [Candidatus Moranbacteria bacterium]
MTKKKNLKLVRAITRNVVRNSLNASAWVFVALIQMGELTINAFLSPSIYADLPASSFDWPGPSSKKTSFKENTIRQSIRRLQKQGFVEKRGNKYVLTKMGKILAKYVLNRKKTLDKKWDNKFRVVIFDIPEDKRKIRNWLRQELYLLNYRKLQESVFISKHSLTEDLIKEIKRRKIGNYVNYLLVEKVYKNII